MKVFARLSNPGWIGGLALTVLAASAPLHGEPIGLGRQILVSRAPSGAWVGYSEGASISADGRLVAFASDDSGLVRGDRNHRSDVFVRDLITKEIVLASRDRRGRAAAGDSLHAQISANGRYVVFWSEAGDLSRVGRRDEADAIYRRDLRRGTTALVSMNRWGRHANGLSLGRPAISSSGRYVAFVSSATDLVRGDTNRVDDVYVRDMQRGRTERVSVSSSGRQANGWMYGWPAISGDGRYVVFASYASNLVPGDTRRFADVFLHDRRTDKTTLVSKAIRGRSNGDSEAPSVSRDGRYVAFASAATNLTPEGSVGVFVRDMVTGRTEIVSKGWTSQSADGYAPSISADGRFVAFESAYLTPNSMARSTQVFLRDRFLGATELISVTENKVVPTESGGAHYKLGPDGPSFAPSVSADGRFVAFQSTGGLVAHDMNQDSDVYVRDRLAVCLAICGDDVA